MQTIKEKALIWTKEPYDKETISEINELISSENEKELFDRFYTTLEFGTGGLRGVIGAGKNRMNIYTVGMATQGLANYIIKNNAADRGVVISRDSRNKSDIFSKETAMILAGNGIKVFFFEDIAPTPLCSYAIRKLAATAGVMITASHNPPIYNGYKVFWDDGGQIVSPQDKEIIGEVNKITSVENVKKIDFIEALKKGLIKYIGKDIYDCYSLELNKFKMLKNINSEIKIVYSPLHGAGYKIIPQLLRESGFRNIITVDEQSMPDGNFPTVKYPNPEEKETMSLTIEYAKRHDADLILATDPDADRMGVGFKDNKGDYILINGNQIGTMLENYILTRLKEDNRLDEKSTVIKTIVTTDLQAEIASSFGCRIENVLTGFKWIAAKMKEYDVHEKNTFVFGGEESYGYLPVDFVRDKDAVSSCYFFCEMAEYLNRNKISLYGYLNSIYEKNSVYIEDLDYITLEGKEGLDKVNFLMKDFRENPPSEIGGHKIVITDDIKSLTRKISHKEQTTVEKITGLPASDVLQFFLENGSKVTMRPSGTEPKIKFYYSVREKSTGDIETTKEILKSLLEKIKTDFNKKISSRIK